MADSSQPSPARASSRESELRAQVETQPENTDALAELGVLCAERGAFGEGYAWLERALEQRKDDPRLHMSAAGIAANDGDLDSASRHYRKALELKPGLPAAHVGLGQIAEHRERLSEAEEQFRAALDTDPESADALLGVGRVHMAQGHVEQAVQMFAQITQRYPRHARALAAYGQALMMRGMPQQAARPLKRALELDSSLQQARLLLGHVQLHRGEATSAEQSYREVLAGNAEDGDALAGLGDALRAQGRMQEAFAAYDAARTQHPEAEVLTTLRAICLGAMDRAGEAAEDLRAYIGSHPRCRSPRLLLADMMLQANRVAEAEAMWRQAAESDPEDALAHAELAMLKERQGDFEAAANAAAGSQADERPSTRLMRARVALRADDHAAAQRELLALKGAPLEPPMARDRLRLLGMVHDRAGRPGEAVLAFREAQRIGAEPLPELVPAEVLREPVAALVADPEIENARVKAPVLLLGLPGSGVERLAGLLADQPGVALREDRFGDHTDFFAEAAEPSMRMRMTQNQLQVHARRYARAQARHVAGEPDVVIDWIPVFDARLLPVIRRALPGVRTIIAEGHPQRTYLQWLAFGWQRRLRMRDSLQAAAWMKQAREQIDLAGEHLPSLRVDVDAVLADPAAAGEALAGFLGLQALRPGPLAQQRSHSAMGLPISFPPGHEAAYSEALSEAFAALR